MATKRGIQYIPAIDGLRAIAVMAVLLYHLGFKWIPGGFLGVDLFFVISGYVITRLLLDSIERSGGLDLRAFYFYDANRTGYIKSDDARKIVHNSGRNLPHRIVKDIISAAEQSGSTIEYFKMRVKSVFETTCPTYLNRTAKTIASLVNWVPLLSLGRETSYCFRYFSWATFNSS